MTDAEEAAWAVKKYYKTFGEIFKFVEEKFAQIQMYIKTF
jgi:hypothetical protein